MNITPNSSQFPKEIKCTMFFIFIFTVNIIFTLYKYTIPSMWHDEIIVAMSTYLDYFDIVKRYYWSDFHPPYYALSVKALSTLNNSDWFLKILSPISGIFSIYIGYKNTKYFGDKFRIYLAIFVTTNFWIILFSRQLRPYAMSFCLSTYCFYVICMIITQNHQRTKFYFTSIFVLMLLHYGNALIVAAQIIQTFLIHIKYRSAFTKKLLLKLLATTFLGTIAIFPFYFARAGDWGKELGFAARFEKLLFNYLSLLCGFRFDTSFSQELNYSHYIVAIALCMLLSGLALYGFICLLNSNMLLAIFPAIWISIPVLYILLPPKQYGAFQEWHLFSILPALFFLAAFGASRMRFSMTLAPFLFIIAISNLYFFNQTILYTASGSKGLYRYLANSICSNKEDSLNVFSSALTYNFVSRYLDIECKKNKLTDININNNQKKITLRFFDGARAIPGLGQLYDDSIATTFFKGITPETIHIPTQRALGCDDFFQLSTYTTDIIHDPVNFLKKNETTSLGDDPFKMLSKCYSMSNTSIKPNGGDYSGGSSEFYMFPSKPNTTGVVTFLYDATNTVNASNIVINITYAIMSKGSVTIFVTNKDGAVIKSFTDTLTSKEKKQQKIILNNNNLNNFMVRIALKSEMVPDFKVFTNTDVCLFSTDVTIN